MKKQSIFFAYLKRHYKLMILMLLFTLIFAAVFALYDLPVEAVAYASALCFTLGLIMLIIGYLRHLRRHRKLTELLHNISFSIAGLPEPQGILEHDYQEILRSLYSDRAKIISAADTAKSDIMSYYTLWMHQIKTPIAAMRLLLQAEENQQSMQLLNELFKIEQYVDMALQYIRLGEGGTDLVLAHFELDSIVRRALRKYAKMFILSRLSLDFRETGLSVLTDEKWLSFIIEQLLSNAIKYTHSGKVSVYAEGETLVVEDTGVGISAEDLPRVFDRGYTGYNGRLGKKSTGIGLYLCKRACRMLGHGIAIESEVGRGTRVLIDLSSVNIKME